MSGLGTYEASRVLQAERTIIRIRWLALAFALAQIFTFYQPYPPGMLLVALGAAGLLAAENLGLWWAATRRSYDADGARRLGIMATILDTLVCMSFVFAYTFDEHTAVWAMVLLLPLVGAVRFGLVGGMTVMAGAAVLYTLREVWGAVAYGNEFLVVSITFRMGIGFIIAAVAGTMASSLIRDRARLAESVESLNQKTDESQSMLQALSEAGVGIVVGDGDRFLYVNDAHCRITGFSRDELMAMSVWDLMDPTEAERVAERFRRRVAGESLDGPYETWMWRKDGTRVDLEVSAKLTFQDGAPRVTTVVRDITERKRLDEMKDAFLTAVSHELRTPMTAVLGFAMTLDREGRNLPLPVVRDMLTRLAVNAQKLERLLSDLLDLDRLTHGLGTEARRRPTDMLELVGRVVDECGLSHSDLVSVDVEPVVAAVEPAKVERILENLLANAAKYTPVGTPVAVTVRKSEGGVLLTVEDSGPGVPAELREAIFEPFRQGVQARSHSPGVGIGLSLVARFAELHGGRAWVEERAGGGAAFHVFLAAATSPRIGSGVTGHDVDARSVGWGAG